MKRGLMIILLVAFSLGLAMESADAECVLNDDGAACCVCLCHTPGNNLTVTSVQKAPAIRQNYVNTDSSLKSSLFETFIFHPPK